MSDLSGVTLFQTDDGGWQLELHDKGWDVEVTLHPDRSTEFFASPVCDGSMWCKSKRHIHGCFAEALTTQNTGTDPRE